MKHLLHQILLLIFLLFPGFVLADIAIMVHGYHSSGNTWRDKGIIHLLSYNGWNDAGTYTPAQGNIAFPGQHLSAKGKHAVTVELPSESPIDIQANLLSHYLDDIHEHFPEQKIHLIGHSAGGLVARLALINSKHQNQFSQLITIATPHYGSPIAEMVEKASDSPIGFIAPLLGGDEINRAEILYSQLGREKNNYFLFWLNRQPHPPIVYTSIVRANDSIISGDWVVPAYSQNMAFVPTISNNSAVFMTPGDHYLKHADGFILMTLLP